MSKVAMIAVLILAALNTGCATSGRNFNSQNLTQLQPGQTTFDQARQLLGAPPVQTVLVPGGNSVSYWRFIRANGFSGHASLREAGLVFTPEGTFLRILQLQGLELSQADRQRLMTLPAVSSSPLDVPAVQNVPGVSRDQRIQELNNPHGLSYEEYQRRYSEITGQ